MTEHQEKIVNLLKSRPEGMTVKQMVKELGISTSTMHRHLADLEQVHIERYASDGESTKQSALWVYGPGPDAKRPPKRLAAKRVIGLDSTKSVAINRSTQWISVTDCKPPTGVKLLLIDRRLGVATLGNYSPDAGWTHWQGMPVFADKEAA